MSSIDETPMDEPWKFDLVNDPGVRAIKKLIPHIERSEDLHERQLIRADAYLPVALTQLSLPYRDPGEVVMWERVNGDKSLAIQPAILRGADGAARVGYPFGVIPRLFLVWLTTEVKRRVPEDPSGGGVRVELGENLEAFMRRLGLGKGGKQRKDALEQLMRIIHARITISDVKASKKAGGSWSHEGQSLAVASSWKLWHADEDEAGQEPLMGSYIDVSSEFCEAAKGAAPLSMDVLRELQSHPMRMDIYVWLVNRLYNRRSESHVSWKQLAGQFGGSYKELRQFRAAFKENLRVVRIYYPRARVSVTKAGLILRPSKHHIPGRQKFASPTSAYEIVRSLQAADSQ